jgi:signal transduction histidine kinase
LRRGLPAPQVLPGIFLGSFLTNALLFNPRPQTASAAKIEGTGLGVAIAHGLISPHGGNIALESSIGRGTTAIVTIPASRVIAIQTAD